MNPHRNTDDAYELPENQSVIDTFKVMQQSLQASGQRGLVIYRAERAACRHRVRELQILNRVVLFSDMDDLGGCAVPFSKAETRLGLEADCVLIDLFSGLNVDVFCMAVGLLKAGRVMVLLCPPYTENWPDRYGQWQDRRPPTPYFLQYFFASLSKSPVVKQIHDAENWPDYPGLPSSVLTPIVDGCTAEQAQMLEHLTTWLANKNQRLFFLTADRGRGKSTTLGLFAMAQPDNRRIVVTAASRAQASVLLNCAGDHRQIEFIAPDELARQASEIDCLIIDEAAMLPASLLQQCLARADKIIMATTTGGYEGTGQGFLIKFMGAFKSSDYRHEQLHHPVRWGRNDLLEQAVNQTLMFDASLQIPEPTHAEVDVRLLGKQQLNDNRDILRAIYALLISAHYRTRPSDLRQLMEDENQQVIVACMNTSVVGVLLLNREGGFSKALSHDVFMGRRRPRGHLLAQMLTAQAGVRDFACWQGYRVQRITVARQYRRQGIGRLLIERAEQLLQQQGLDYLGSCFALDATVSPFWERMGFVPVHVSAGKGKSSGRQTVAVIKTSKPPVKIAIQSLATKIQRDLPVWLLGYCRDMLWQDVRALLALLKINYPLSRQDEEEVKAFSQGHRGFDLSQAALQRLMISTVYKQDLYTDFEQQLLIEKVILNRPWQDCAGFTAAVGRKALTSQIRKLIERMA